MALVWAADPTRETDKPTLIAGRIPDFQKRKKKEEKSSIDN